MWCLAAVLTSCGGGEQRGIATVTPLAVPAAAGSRFPHIAATANDTLAMIWIEGGAPGAGRVLGAKYDGRQWDEPRLIVEDEALFINWADFPSFAPLDDGSLAVHSLHREGQRSYAYGIRFNVLSADWEQSFAAMRPHQDRSDTEHGFVSMIPEGSSGVGCGNRWT